MWVISLLISGRIQQHAAASHQRERRTSLLHTMSRNLATRRKIVELVEVGFPPHP